jgi:NTP pyrophosphatase (non-canonical NTP hydrolase)
MEFKEYQEKARKSAVYPGSGGFQGLCYCGLKLGGETGEVLEKIGKAWRDNSGIVDETRRGALILELGDVLWYITSAVSS